MHLHCCLEQATCVNCDCQAAIQGPRLPRESSTTNSVASLFESVERSSLMSIDPHSCCRDLSVPQSRGAIIMVHLFMWFDNDSNSCCRDLSVPQPSSWCIHSCGSIMIRFRWNRLRKSGGTDCGRCDFKKKSPPLLGNERR
jgi:hypothetical protein